MLQQTQVATVIPYYERFLAAFPTVRHLAAAPEERVLRLWEGLGYYRRARSLHRCARLLVQHYGGSIPDDPHALAELPGMGRYTVAAVLSQAYERRLPILEANSRRLLARLFASEDKRLHRPTDSRLWQLAEALLPRRRVGEFNQALMEIGALVCTPAKPRCDECPLRRQCRARVLGLAEKLPLRPSPPRTEFVPEVAVVPSHLGWVLILERPDHGRWAGLWEFPRGTIREGEATADAARRILRELAGLDATPGPAIATLSYSVTRFRMRMICLRARCRGQSFTATYHAGGKWVRPEELARLPLSAPQRRLAKQLG